MKFVNHEIKSSSTEWSGGNLIHEEKSPFLDNGDIVDRIQKGVSPRQRLGVFSAQPSRHVRSQDDQACSRGFSVTWDSTLDT